MGIAADRYEWFVEHVRNGTLTADEAQTGFADDFLAAVPAEQLVVIAQQLAPVVLGDEETRVEGGDALQVVYETMQALVNVEATPPHRFTGLVFRNRDETVDDPRVANPRWTTEGDADGPAAALADAYRAQGLVGVTAAGYGDNGRTPLWKAVGGWADLEADRDVVFGTRMLAGSITKLFTVVTVLQRVAAGEVDLDRPVNDYLTTLRVASDAVTARHLLTHRGGVNSNFEHFVAEVEPAVNVLGEVVAVDFEPGSRFEYSNGGYTVLGELVSSVTGRAWVDVAATDVLEPLGMRDSSLPLRWPDDVGPGYSAENDVFSPMDRLMPSVPPAGGLVTTPDDLALFVAGWRDLLPDGFADAAIHHQADRDGGAIGFGWLLSGDVVGHAGGTLTYSSSLLWNPTTGACGVVITNRNTSAEAINVEFMRPRS